MQFKRISHIYVIAEYGTSIWVIKPEVNFNWSTLINWKDDVRLYFFFLNLGLKIKRFKYKIVCDIWIICFLDHSCRKYRLGMKNLQKGFVEEAGGFDNKIMVYMNRIDDEWEGIPKGIWSGRVHEELDWDSSVFLVFVLNSGEPLYTKIPSQENIGFQIEVILICFSGLIKWNGIMEDSFLTPHLEAWASLPKLLRTPEEEKVIFLEDLNTFLPYVS